MRLGMVMAGCGAAAAANVGVLQELCDRGMEPCCLCGVQAGAWPAALWISDRKAWKETLSQAQRMGRRMLRAQGSIRSLLTQKNPALADAVRLEHLLVAQAGQRMLCICPKPGMIQCRTAQTGRKVLFSSRPCNMDNGALVAMQPTISFAARAAMTLPPFLMPLQWMGTPLIADDDVGFAARQLLAMGAQRVLIVLPSLSARRKPDAMDLVGMMCRAEYELPAQSALLDVALPPHIGALSVNRLEEIALIGRQTAQRHLDGIMERLGMAHCRVLPFRQRCNMVSR